MLEQIEISVLLSFYNTEIDLLKRAINSLANQDFKQFELLIINDGSEAGLEEKINSFLLESNINYRYYQHENIGQSFSINELISLCNGKYITILDADDEYKTNHLSACMNEMKHADLIASTSETIVDNEEDYYIVDKNDPNKKIHVDDCILFATLFGKKEIFEKYPFKKMYSADSTFFEAASANYTVKKINLRTYIYYRNNPNSICANYKKEQSKSII
jgi:glycosyltransferase involved in cell wall biosynthesis